MAAYLGACNPPFSFDIMRDCYDVRSRRWVHFPAGTYREQIATAHGRLEKQLVEMTANVFRRIGEVKGREAKGWQVEKTAENPAGIDPESAKDFKFLQMIKDKFAS